MKTKRVTLDVEIVVEIPEDVDPNDVRFRMTEGEPVPMVGGKDCGKAISYRTHEYLGEEPDET